MLAARRPMLAARRPMLAAWVLSLVWACASTPPEQRMEELAREAIIDSVEGHYARSAEKIDRVVEMSETTPLGDERMADLLTLQANCYWELGRDAEAHVSLDRALELQGGSDRHDPGQLKGLKLRADLLRQAARYEDAVRTMERVVRIREQHYGASDADLGVELYELAGLRRALDDRAGAEEAYRRSIAVLESVYPRYHQILILAITEYTQYIRNTDRSEETLRYMHRLRELDEEAWKTIR